jgi:hypothetical protein
MLHSTISPAWEYYNPLNSVPKKAGAERVRVLTTETSLAYVDLELIQRQGAGLG